MDYLKISDEKVKTATRKEWRQWFSILDKWKAEEHGHTATAKHLREKHRLSDWWAQVVTIRYEKERGYWVRHSPEE
jgi:hypothetical protein